MITRERVLELLEYRPETGEFFWRTTGKGRGDITRPAGCTNPRGYRVINISGRNYYRHRLVWLVETNTLVKMIDHKNNRPGNDWFNNLRVCNGTQNQGNSSGRRNEKSKFKGVTRTSDNRCWQAYIGLNKKRLHLGTFKDETAAAKAYDAAAIKHFGEFARPNFPVTN